LLRGLIPQCTPKRAIQRARISLAALGCLAGFGIVAPAAEAGDPPPGFAVEPVLSGLDTPVAIDFASGGRMFVAEKSGVVRVFKNGQLLPTPFVDIAADVNNHFEHGLLGMAVHPQFPSTPYVYLLYTHDPPGVLKDQPGARVARLERITASSANPDVAASGAEARTVLLGRNGDASTITDPTTAPNLTCWRNGTRVEDCIPQDSFRHQIGTVTFGPDGALYVGNGDGDRLPGGPQDPANHVGAILRIDPMTGNGLPDNPFYNGNPQSNISKTWAYGLRNPFRFSFDPVSEQMFIGDVGAQTWDAIHLGQAGKNYGWPCYEAGSHVYGTYQNTSLCQSVYAAGPRPPLHAYQHTAAGGSVIGGDWYHGTAYPTAYRGRYFFADYSQGWIKFLQPNGLGGYTASPFLDDGGTGGTTSGIVQLVAGPNGDLHWVSINNGAVYRLSFTGGPPPPPDTAVSLDFSEGQGTVAADGSGNGNDADLRNGAGWNGGKVGGGLALDGVNDFASIDDSPTLNRFTDKFTVAGWTRRPSSPAGWRMLVSRQLGTTNEDQFFLGFKDGVPNFGINTPSGGNQRVGSGAAPLNQWVHLAGVYDGTRMTLYVNGIERATLAKTGNVASSSRPVLVGANANGIDPLAVSQNLGGGADQVRIFGRALSGGEIADLANPTEPPQVTITEPSSDVTVDVGTTVNFAATAEDPVEGDLSDEIAWSAELHHNVHTHPDYLPPTAGPGGSFVFDDHGDDIFVELCAEATNSAGRSDEDCVNVRPRTTTVTIDSAPRGRDVSFGELNRATPYTVEANVGATRTLSAPLASGCFQFQSWSDGGAATHQIVVPGTNPTYAATFTDTCGGPTPVLSLDFEEGQGTIAADGSGNGNDADLLNGATWGSGMFGGGLTVDGVNDVAAVADSPSLNQFTDELTVAAWVNRPSTATGWGILASRQHGTTIHDQFFIGFKDGVPKFGVHTAVGGMTPKPGTGSTPLGQWAHLAGVYDGSHVALYVNGVLRQSLAKSGPISASSRPVLIGANANGVDPLAANENLRADVDEVRLYSRALSAAEIGALAAGP